MTKIKKVGIVLLCVTVVAVSFGGGVYTGAALVLYELLQSKTLDMETFKRHYRLER